jgi:hypothetical protein
LGQEIEPNNTDSEANVAYGLTVLRGSFAGPWDRDVFLIGNVIDRDVQLKVTARILTGEAAGTNTFDMGWFVVGRRWAGYASGGSISDIPSRRVIRTRVRRQPNFDPYLGTTISGDLAIELSSRIEGDYEVRIEVEQADNSGPNILFRPYVRAHLKRELFPNEKEIRISVRDFAGLKTVRVSSPGNPPLTLRPSEDKLYGKSSVLIRYPLRRNRPTETLTIRAEDLAGNHRTKTVVFHRR